VAAINLTGNAFAQTITGNAGANRLDGGIDAVSDRLVGLGGNDTYMINSSTDLIDEVAGGGVADRIQTTVSFRLAADDNIEIMMTSNAKLTTAINLTGNALAQTIYGNAGANILNGGTDTLRDTMFGYGGNDTYFIGSSTDVIVEALGGGTADRVRASVSFVLAADDDIESLEASNPAAGTVINLTGNALGQTVVGNAGSNILNGGLGNDTLTGLAGADSFLFNTSLNAISNHDIITDFNIAADTIQLDNAIFQSLAVGGTLAANLFEATSIAGQNGAEVVIYDRFNGDLYYDSNGAATANGLILFAHVANGTALTNADFFVV
jgi:Ca2+-binding RTX toxin-like protein